MGRPIEGLLRMPSWLVGLAVRDAARAVQGEARTREYS